MVYFCDACRTVYEINRTDVLCIYCGACSCHPYDPPSEEN